MLNRPFGSDLRSQILPAIKKIRDRHAQNRRDFRQIAPHLAGPVGFPLGNRTAAYPDGACQIPLGHPQGLSGVTDSRTRLGKIRRWNHHGVSFSKKN